jgi:hypothetical protein
MSPWDERGGPAQCRPGSPPARSRHRTEIDTERKERIMPRLELGAVRATFRTVLRRLDAWTLESMNSPAGGRRPRS